MSSPSLEVRVGLLVLAAVAVLGRLVFLLGGFGLGGAYVIHVDFDNPGNLRPGATVHIGGMEVGSVEEISFRPNRIDPSTGKRSLVRVRLRLRDDVREIVREDALAYVTTQSVLGEPVIAIDPGHPERPPLQDGAVLVGVDPPRLDLALALGFELLEGLVQLMRTHREDIEALLRSAASVLKSVDGVFQEHGDRIDAIVVNLEQATKEASALAASARARVDSPEVQRIITNLDRSLQDVERDLAPLLADARSATSKVDEVLDTFGPEERAQLRSTLENASELAAKANEAVSDAREIVSHIRDGQGTVGAVVMDRELYDDLQEMVRDLKHNPWKFLWRE